MLAKSLSFLAGADAAGIVLGARVPIILTSRADSVMTRLASCAVAALVAQRAAREPAAKAVGLTHGRRDRRPERRLVEPQVLAVRRARRRARSWSRAGRPKGCTRRRASSRRTAPASVLDEKSWGEGVELGHDGALDHLVAFLRAASLPSTGSSASATASCTAGSSTRSPCASTRRSSRRSRSTFRSRRCTSRTTSRRSARCSSARRSCRRSRASTPRSTAAQPPVAQAFALPQGDHRPRRAPLRLPRPVVRVHRAACCRGTTRARRAGRTVVLHLGNGSSMCAIAGGRSVASTMGFTAVDGLPMGTRCGNLDPGVVLYLMDELEDGRARDREADLPAVGPARRVRHLERHAHARGERRAARRRRRSTSSSTGSAASSGSLAAALGGLDAIVFTAGIGENSRGAARARLPRCGVARRRARRRGQRSATGRASAPPGSRVSAWVIPTNEELMIARHTRRAAGAVADLRKERDDDPGHSRARCSRAEGARRRRRQRALDRLRLREGVPRARRRPRDHLPQREGASLTSSRSRASWRRRCSCRSTSSVPGELEAVFDAIATAVGQARHPRALDRVRAEGGPAGRAPQLLGRRASRRRWTCPATRSCAWRGSPRR